ncbi:hypothetical protein TNCV_3407901 [Trichonephila clavipes]|nr:hypothetical protein TNCV_3407901 [Trichonephila clavipes]
MENTHRRSSDKRPKKRRFRGNQFMKICPHTNVAERRNTVSAEESMKRAAVEENSSSSDILLTISGDGTWKMRGHSSLIGVCTVIGAETGKVSDREVSSFCKRCDSY